MKRATRILVMATVSAILLHAQFGGILNRVREKIDNATEKAKPVTYRADRAVENFTPWTPEEEQQIGEATAAKMVAMFGLVDSPKLVRYVNLVGQAVAQYAPRQLPYRFGILDSDIVGAFALPGGFIFITRAAVEAMNDESQLAGALGHEIVHVSERHLEAEIRGKKNSAWAIEEAKAKATAGPQLLRNRADALLNDLLTTRLSRDKEDGADQRGTLMAAQAGYAAGGLLEFLRTLAQVQARSEDQRAFGQLLSTHPPFNERIAHLTPIVQRAGIGGKTLEARFNAALK
jgi:predicted Zn-dependent protease